MMFKHTGIILLIVISAFAHDNEEDDVFVPTKDWQVVRKGQKIPPGLHIRINFETGITEAKLYDDEDVDKSKRALLAIPDENPKAEEATRDDEDDDFLTPDDFKNIKDQLKGPGGQKRSGKIKLNLKFEAEMIAVLLKKHEEVMAEKKIDEAEILRILEDLEFLAHQYDNAIEFVKQNGFEMIYKNLNSSEPKIRGDTLRLMTALMQNNPKPMNHALETGAVGVLLRVISLDPDSVVKARALTALSALVRSHHDAEQKFIESGGVSVVFKFFNTNDIKLQVKVTAMISDLVIRKQWREINQKYSKQYREFDLERHLVDNDWCQNMNRLLIRLMIGDSSDHDAFEKCLIAMHSMRISCAHHYDKKVLEEVHKRYEILRATDTERFGDLILFDILKDVSNEILVDVNKYAVKTEL